MLGASLFAVLEGEDPVADAVEAGLEVSVTPWVNIT
jgi:hypothetical protein